MTTVPAWHERAACAGHPHPEWWDGRIDGEAPEDRTRRHQAAAAVCRTCPVAAQCWADRARSHGVHAGCWNGNIIRIPGGPAPLRPCGTTAAHRRHIRRGEKPCDACRAAMSEWRKARKAERDITPSSAAETASPPDVRTARGRHVHEEASTA